MQQFGYSSLTNMGLEQIAQRIPGLILKLGDSLVDFTQNLETHAK